MVVEEDDKYVTKGALIPMPRPLNNFNNDPFLTRTSKHRYMSVQHRAMPSYPNTRNHFGRSARKGSRGMYKQTRMSSGRGRINYALPQASFDMASPQFASMSKGLSHQSGIKSIQLLNVIVIEGQIK